MYDKYGRDIDQQRVSSSGPAGGFRSGNTFYYHSEDVTPEQLFNMFFGMHGFPQTHHRQGKIQFCVMCMVMLHSS